MKSSVWVAGFALLFAALAFFVFALRRARTYLHIFQQEEYDGTRFISWLGANRAFDKRATMAIFLIGALNLMGGVSMATAYFLTGAALLLLTSVERDPRRLSKKKLSMTSRATRIFWTALLLLALLAWVVGLSGEVFLFVLLVQFIPLALVAGNLLNLPYESRLQKRFWNEAHAKLQSLKPTVVGITGSYGKTSTKHLLGHILEIQAPTLITPGSVNTPMGIARVVRERLQAQHRFFVCEMGAYGPGSIARLCRLAPPDVAVITAIGMAHYERFKTLDIVATAKFELAEAVALKQGPVIAAEQVLGFEAARRFRAAHPNFIAVGTGAECTARVLSYAQTEAGIQADVLWMNTTYSVKAPIFGEHHISNMVLAFAAACSLGVAPEDAILALASAPQISHRLEVKSAPSGARIIDDAYNSNPVGFASALRLLNDLRSGEGRRILVTPGMVELGAAHEQEHARIGQFAGGHADVLLAVLPERIESFVAAFAQANPSGTVLRFPAFAAAQQWLDANLQAHDVVLLENDLPDLYEAKLSL